MPFIQYAFRDEAKNITMLTQGSTAACPLCQIVTLRKREITPEFLGHYLAMDSKRRYIIPASALTEYGRNLKQNQDDCRYFAIIDSQIEFTVKPRIMQKLAEFMPAYTGAGLYNFFEGQPYGFLVVLRVFESNEYIPTSLMKKGRMGGAQIFSLYNTYGEKTQHCISDKLTPIIDEGTFEYIKYEILHTLRLENALIGVYGNDEDSKRLLRQKRDDYNDSSGQYKHAFNEKDDVDRSQVDYEEIYNRVVKLAPSLSDFIEYVRNIKPPQMVECQEMFQRMLSGDEQARCRIVEMYLRNIVRMSLFYAEKYHVPIEDVIQDGVRGMMAAIEKFDPSGTESFLQYFPFWVMQVIQRELPHYLYSCYVPIHSHEKIQQIKELALAHGYVLPYDIDSIDSSFVAIICSELGITESKIDEYLRTITVDVSIEEMIERISDENISEPSLIVDTIGETIETAFYQQLHSTIDSVLYTLSPREERVLRLRHGFEDGRSKTLEEVGTVFNCTRERVRQIESKAIRKLRHPTRKKKLRPFYD